ncbi:MAG: hypothetical protein WC001_04895 [Desulfurivibrionaceae bacterium]
MTKRTIWAVVTVFAVWSILDFILHGLFLQATYEATANLWRPMDQMNMPLLYFVTLVFAVCFVLIYGFLVGEKSLASGLLYGALFGLATGISMGFGSYSYMPIPLTLAWSWFVGTWIEAITAGAIVGVIMKPAAR